MNKHMMARWRQGAFAILRHCHISIPFIVLAACTWAGYIEPDTFFLVAMMFGATFIMGLFCLLYITMPRREE